MELETFNNLRIDHFFVPFKVQRFVAQAVSDGSKHIVHWLQFGTKSFSWICAPLKRHYFKLIHMMSLERLGIKDYL